MKRFIYSLLFVLVACFSVFSQTTTPPAPFKFNYQAVARDANGAFIDAKDIGVRISILEGSITVYSESQIKKTNRYGLFNLIIGEGTFISGSAISNLNWAGNSKKIKIDIDPNGGSNYTTIGTADLLSVPYALYANNAGNISTGTSSSKIKFNAGSGINIDTSVANTVKISNAFDSTKYLKETDKVVGDVSGTYKTLSVEKIKGKTVDTTGLGSDSKSKKILIYNGTAWKVADLPASAGTITAGRNLEFNATKLDLLQALDTVTSINAIKGDDLILSQGKLTRLRIGDDQKTELRGDVLTLQDANGKKIFFKGDINTSKITLGTDSSGIILKDFNPTTSNKLLYVRPGGQVGDTTFPSIGGTGKLLLVKAPILKTSNINSDTIGIQQADATKDGYLSKSDYTSFINKIGIASTPANGDMIYYDGTNWVALPKGNNGQIIKSNGTAPTWVDDSLVFTRIRRLNVRKGDVIKYDGTKWAASPDSVGIGTSKWNLNASGIDYTTGNVGIGTTQPLADLHIKAKNNASVIVDGPRPRIYLADGVNDPATDTVIGLDFQEKSFRVIMEPSIGDIGKRLFTVNTKGDAVIYDSLYFFKYWEKSIEQGQSLGQKMVVIKNNGVLDFVPMPTGNGGIPYTGKSGISVDGNTNIITADTTSPFWSAARIGVNPVDKTTILTNTPQDISKVLSWNGTTWIASMLSGGNSSNFSVNSPLSKTPNDPSILSISQATSAVNGYLSAIDWNRFNEKIGVSGTPALGDMLYHNGNEWATLPGSGTTGFVLKYSKFNGPVWATEDSVGLHKIEKSGVSDGYVIKYDGLAKTWKAKPESTSSTGSYKIGSGLNLLSGNVLEADSNKAIWSAGAIGRNDVDTNSTLKNLNSDIGKVLTWDGYKWTPSVPNTIPTTITCSSETAVLVQRGSPFLDLNPPATLLLNDALRLKVSAGLSLPTGTFLRFTNTANGSMFKGEVQGYYTGMGTDYFVEVTIVSAGANLEVTNKDQSFCFTDPLASIPNVVSTDATLKGDGTALTPLGVKNITPDMIEASSFVEGKVLKVKGGKVVYANDSSIFSANGGTTYKSSKTIVANGDTLIVKLSSLDSTYIVNGKLGYSDLTSSGASIGQVLTYTANGWKPSSGSVVTGWALTGNLGTLPTTNYIGTNDANGFNIRTNNLPRIGISELGNIGIGNVTLPIIARAQFEQRGAVSGVAAIFGGEGAGISLSKTAIGFNQYFDGISPKSIGAGFGGYLSLSSSTGDITFGTDNGASAVLGANLVVTTTSKLIIAKNGNVGIGNSFVSPLSKLHVNGYIRSDSLKGTDSSFVGVLPNGMLVRRKLPAGASNAWLVGGNTFTGSTTQKFGTISNDNIGFVTNAIDRFTITRTGAAVFNTDYYDISCLNYSLKTNGGGTAILVDANSLVGIGGATQATYALTVNGNMKVTGLINSSNITETSDARYKTNVSTIGNALATVQQLRGVIYDWKRKDFPEMNFKQGKDLGLIAQEVEKVLPELVNTDEKGFKSVQYSHLVSVLVEAIKEQQKQIETLKAEVSDKDNKVQNNENRIKTLESSVSTLSSQMQLLLELVGKTDGVKASK